MHAVVAHVNTDHSVLFGFNPVWLQSMEPRVPACVPRYVASWSSGQPPAMDAQPDPCRTAGSLSTCALVKGLGRQSSCGIGESRRVADLLHQFRLTLVCNFCATFSLCNRTHSHICLFNEFLRVLILCGWRLFAMSHRTQASCGCPPRAKATPSGPTRCT
ncbi:hypothetical protein BC834DRAFT_304600 [Gloeopeniophorella convolvens]|nr:hypothetical protein BC834DRAFT_304600 [Gloeopeniophorella convolvens]